MPVFVKASRRARAYTRSQRASSLQGKITARLKKHGGFTGKLSTKRINQLEGTLQRLSFSKAKPGAWHPSFGFKRG